MELAVPDLYPDPSVTRDAQIEMQKAVAKRARFASDGLPETASRTVVGVDQAFTDTEALSVAVALQDGEVRERSIGRAPLRMPYVPGLLSFREGEAVVDALEGLTVDPDLLLCDGSGRIHYRQAGLATHLGVLFDCPAVGVAKQLLCGQPSTSLAVHLQEGEKREIVADDEVEPVTTEDHEWPRIGCAYQSRQFPNPERRHVNPLYVSPGHRMTAMEAIERVAEHCRGHKLPQPIRLADSQVDSVRGKD